VKRSLILVFATAFFLVAGTGIISAQVYAGRGIVGYAVSFFQIGTNLFANPLYVDSYNDKALDNTLDVLFDPAPPEGTTVFLWNSTNQTFDVSSTFTKGAWSVNLFLPPGVGSVVVAPSAFTNSIIGIICDHSGNILTNFMNNGIPPAPLLTNPPGVYLFGDACPLIDVGTDIFLNILGRMPYVGEKVTTTSGSSTYLGNWAWDVVPVLHFGQSAFFTTLPEPPPVLQIITINGQAVVSWPQPASGWMLQTNVDLTSNAWGDYAGVVVNNIATNTFAGKALYFRLAHP